MKQNETKKVPKVRNIFKKNPKSKLGFQFWTFIFVHFSFWPGLFLEEVQRIYIILKMLLTNTYFI